MKYRVILVLALTFCLLPVRAAADARSDARDLIDQLNPINLALGPLIDHAISSGNDALAQRLEQMRSIIQETLFNLNRIIDNTVTNVNSDAAARIAQMHQYVQDNLATIDGIAHGSIDALDASAKTRIDQLGDKAGNIVLALPIPAQPLPNVPGEGYGLVKATGTGGKTPFFITGAGLMRGGTRPRAFVLTGDSATDSHWFRHDGTEVDVTAASMGLIELQIPESLFPKNGQAERTLVLDLNAGGDIQKNRRTILSPSALLQPS